MNKLMSRLHAITTVLVLAALVYSIIQKDNLRRDYLNWTESTLQSNVIEFDNYEIMRELLREGKLQELDVHLRELMKIKKGSIKDQLNNPDISEIWKERARERMLKKTDEKI